MGSAQQLNLKLTAEPSLCQSERSIRPDQFCCSLRVDFCDNKASYDTGAFRWFNVYGLVADGEPQATSFLI